MIFRQKTTQKVRQIKTVPTVLKKYNKKCIKFSSFEIIRLDLKLKEDKNESNWSSKKNR
jgi:hypothetical protein